MWDDIYLAIHNVSGWGLAYQASDPIPQIHRALRLDYLKCWSGIRDNSDDQKVARAFTTQGTTHMICEPHKKGGLGQTRRLLIPLFVRYA